jgi:hypothetical protein
MTPGTRELTVQRGTPFVYRIDFPDYDLTTAGLAAQVRLYRDQPGAPLISLTSAQPLAQGLSVTVATDDDGVPTSTLQIRINETTIEELLPFPDNGLEPAEPVVLAWDLHLTISPVGKRRWIEGPFTISPGVTR